MQLLQNSEIAQVSGAAWFPSLDAENDVILPKEWALGLTGAVTALFLAPAQSYRAKGWVMLGGFVAGCLIVPVCQEIASGFPHVKQLFS